MLLDDNWIRQCCHSLFYLTYFQVNVNSINSVPDSDNGVEKNVLKEEVDPLLVTLQDTQGRNEVCFCVQLSMLHRDMHECVVCDVFVHLRMMLL
jgi:hypothetical protein